MTKFTNDLDEKLKRLEDKKNKLDKLRPLPPELVKNLEDWFRIELTYTSNAIEGNSLTRSETAMVLEKGITVKGKTLKEQLEAVNLSGALDYVSELVENQKQSINQNDLLDLHQLVLDKIDDQNAGIYRQVDVMITGALFDPPPYEEVPELMSNFFVWLNSAGGQYPVITATKAHYKLVAIHPFSDGNGRTARLLMNLILMRAGYPPAIIRKEDRKDYLCVLGSVDADNNLAPFVELIIKAVNRSLDIYLKALTGSPSEKKAFRAKLLPSNLLKTSDLARKAGETPATIRFWANQGLLKPKDVSASGYMKFDESSLKQIEKIRAMQKQENLSLAEIKRRLSHD